jgi:hypothetical protein
VVANVGAERKRVDACGAMVSARSPWTCLLAVCCLLTASCGDDETARGELGNVDFTYECVDQSDFQCLRGDPSVPAAVGVGGKFQLSGDELFSNELSSASPTMVEESSEGFTWRREGHAAILIFEAFGEIEDFLHLKGVEVRALRVEDALGATPFEVSLMAGTTFELTAIPNDAAGSPLAGAFSYVWQSEDATVVATSPGLGSNRVTLQGVSEGSATVRVAAVGVSSEVVVTVTSNPNLPELGDGGGSETPRDGGGPSDAGPCIRISSDGAMNDAGSCVASRDGGRNGDLGDAAVIDAGAPLPLADAAGLPLPDAAQPPRDAASRNGDAGEAGAR